MSAPQTCPYAHRWAALHDDCGGGCWVCGGTGEVTVESMYQRMQEINLEHRKVEDAIWRLAEFIEHLSTEPERTNHTSAYGAGWESACKIIADEWDNLTSSFPTNSAWQPMETLPEGKLVLVWHQTGPWPWEGHAGTIRYEEGMEISDTVVAWRPMPAGPERPREADG